jgi:proline dehydrogenase
MENKINFSDFKTAYRYKSTKELRFAYFIFRILQYPWLVQTFTRLSQVIIQKDLPFQSLIRRTIFRVFCAGESLRDALATIGKLNSFRVKSVLDYVSESEISPDAFDENRRIIINNIALLGKDGTGNSVSIKLSSLEDPDFFKRINNIKAPRSTDDEHRFGLLMKRVESICAQGKNSGVIIYIDAEDHFMQDVFDHIAERMMEKFNSQEAVVYNTLQMYLRDRPAYLDHLIYSGIAKRYYPGIKLVRGAYVEKEKERALSSGLASPVFDSKEATDEAFDNAVVTCLRNHHQVFTCIASHNSKSTMLAVECIRKLGINDHYRKVRFSQLYGMSDHLTFNLAASGYNSSKYLPYGELKKAIPYLIRRAQENSSINGQISGEVAILRSELERRRKNRKPLLR